MPLTGVATDDVWPLVRDHHYSGRMPSNIQHCYAIRSDGGLFGDFGDEIYAACVFSIPPTRWSEEVLELSRLVRRPDYSGQLSSLVSFSVRCLKRQGHDLLISFADWTQRHHGGVYQASSWNYHGQRDRRIDGVYVDGVFVTARNCRHIYGSSLSTENVIERERSRIGREITPHYDEGKHLYWKPLSKEGKRRAGRLGLEKLSYPKPSSENAIQCSNKAVL